MDYKVLTERLKCPKVKECPYDYIWPCKECQKELHGDAITAITDLLARAEAAEARAEKAERERDAAVKWIKEFTESIDRPCAACKHDTGDYVALGVCGGCSKDNNKWEWKGMEE